MPIGKLYKNFQDCVNKNRDKRNPQGYCASIERTIRERRKRKRKKKKT